MEANLVTQIDEAIEELSGVIERIDNGDITFSEAGDWIHNWGEDIVSVLDKARKYITEGAV